MRIEDAFASVKACYFDWEGFLVNPRFYRSDIDISWGNRVSSMLDDPISENDVIDLIDRGQYTYQISADGSPIQLHYRFDRLSGDLEHARLAYYRTLNDEQFYKFARMSSSQGFAMDYEGSDGSFDEQITYDAVVDWLRIDYDPRARIRGVIHHDCHMHISGFPEARFVLSGVPSPSQFVEFLIASFYPQNYEAHRLREVHDQFLNTIRWQYKRSDIIEKVNHSSTPIDANDVYDAIVHFQVPSRN